MHWYWIAWKKYAVFSGRARRSEYWYGFLINSLIVGALLIAEGLMASFAPRLEWRWLSGGYALAFFMPGIAGFVRRLHDTGRSGWWLLVGLLPTLRLLFGSSLLLSAISLVAAISVIVFLSQDSQPGENRWGANPKH